VFLNGLLLEDADVNIHPAVGQVHWADFSDPSGLIHEGERAALESLVEVRKTILHFSTPQRTLVDQIKSIKEKIVDKVVGQK
jgi:hypothetical protein